MPPQHRIAVNCPMIGDPDRAVADLDDMIRPKANDTLTVRSVSVIAPDKTVTLTLTYPASTGRNFDEIISPHCPTRRRRRCSPTDGTPRRNTCA